MLRRFLAGGASLAALLAAAPALAEAVDSPIATAPTEIVEYVRDPQPVAAFKLAQLTLTPSYAAVFGRNAPTVTPVNFVPNAVMVGPEFSPKWASGFPASPTVIEAFYFRCSEGSTTVTPDKNFSCYNTILTGNFIDVSCGGAKDAEHTPGLPVINESPNAGGTLRFNFSNSTCGTNNSALAASGSSNLLNTSWHHLLIYADVSQGNNAGCGVNLRCGGVLLDGAQVVSGITDQGVWALSKTINFDTNPFYIGAFQGTQLTGTFEIAQFYLNTSDTPVVSGTNTFNFPISKFYNAGPVDFGPTCALPTGNQPLACLTGAPGAAYLVNAGSGANPTAVQQNANTFNAKAYAAAFAPGEIPDRPFVRWRNSRNWGACAESGPSCTIGTNAGNQMFAGDLICGFASVTAGSGSAHTYNFAASGWTTVIAPYTSNLQNTVGFCKTVSGGDVTAAGSNWAGFTMTFTGGFQSWNNSDITMVEIGKYGASGTTPLVSAASGASAASGSIPYPTVTAPSGLSLLVGLTSTYNWGLNTPPDIGPPTTSQLHSKVATGANSMSPMLWFEKLSASGTINRSAQESGVVGNPTHDNILIFN